MSSTVAAGDAHATHACGAEDEPHADRPASGGYRLPQGNRPHRDGQAGLLLELAGQRFDIRQADGQTVVIPRASAAGDMLPPNLALSLRGRGALNQHLHLLFRDAGFPGVPSKAAVEDALNAVDALGVRADEVTLHLRFAHLAQERQLVVDLGTSDGATVVVTTAGWSVVAADECPVAFRRSTLAGAYDPPNTTQVVASATADVLGDLDLLRRHVNISDSDWPLLLGWMVAAHLDGPTPVLLLTGQAGTGKSFAARAVIDIVDPQKVPLRQLPRDEDQLTFTALSNSVMAFDNVSKISPALSDALCQLVTGHGRVARKLYTDMELVPTYLRRSIIMTSIDAGTLRGDLATRLLPLELSPLDDRRLDEGELERSWKSDRPRIHAALLTLISRIIAVLDQVELSPIDRSVRMADFARVLAALDTVCDVTGASSAALTHYAGSQRDVQITVAEGEPLAEAIKSLLASRPDRQWSGSWPDFLNAVRPWRDPHDKDWPTTGQQASGRVKRISEALDALGIAARTSKSNGTRKVTFTVADPERCDLKPGRVPLPLDPF